MKRRMLSIAICLSMVLSVTNTNVFATEIESNNGELIVSEEDTSDVISEEISISNSGEEITLDEEVDEINSTDEVTNESDDTITEEKSEDDSIVSENKIEESEEELLSTSDGQLVASGNCGVNVTYSIYDTDGDDKGDYVEINGSGSIYNYNDYNKYSPFYNNTNVTKVIINKGVTSIGSYAFYICSSLSSIEIPSGVTSIGDDAFNGCSNLSSIEIPSGVTSIGDDAFNGCSNLSSIELPDGITSIGSSAFNGCSNLSSIEIPSGVTSIGSHAFFYCSSLSSIEIPSGVTSIGDYAFYGCSSLGSINIPNGVTSIGYEAFYGCSSLSSIVIPSGVTSIGSSAFYGCSSLGSINIPNGITSISSSAFNGCSNLSSIEIPESVTSIGDYAFNHCSSLSSIELPSGVTSIGSLAFYNCPKLKSIYINTQICKFYTDVSLGNNWKGSKAAVISNIQGEHSFEEIVITQGTDTVKGTVEYKCSNCSYKYQLKYYKEGNECTLAGISGIPSDHILQIPDEIDGGKVIAISNNAFKSSNLSSIEIPDGVTSIGSSAFYGCSSLGSIEIPEGVTSIGSSAFYKCENLKNIYIPSSVTSMGSNCVGMYYNNVTGVYEPISDFVIYGYKNTEAEIYANSNGITFNACTPSEYAIKYELDGGTNNDNNPISYTQNSSVTIYEPIKTGYMFEGWYTESTFENLITEIPSTCNKDITLYAKWRYLFTLENYQVALNGGFDLKYIMKLSDEVLNDSNSYMEFTINGNKQTVKPTQKTGNGAAYYCSVPAKNLGDTIIARLFVNDKYYDVSEYSIKEYLDIIIENEDNNAQYSLVNGLAKSILNYGSFCQKYFGYNTDKLANENLYTPSNNPVNNVSNDDIISQIKDNVVITNNNSDFTYAGASLTCMNYTYLNLYFSNNSNMSIGEINNKYNIYVNGASKSDVEYQIKDGFLEITVKGIPAAELDDTYAFVIKSSEGSLIAEYSPMVYIKKALTDEETSTELKDLCKALYLYNQEANKYFDKYLVE